MNLTLPPLPYRFDALEPHISSRTVEEHYVHHQSAYLEKTRSLIQGTPLESVPLEQIVVHSRERKDSSLFNAAAQAWNHDFFWHSMRPGGGGAPFGTIAPMVTSGFGSNAAFCQAFLAAAGNQFGSGWAWLVLNGRQLEICTTANAGTPLTSPQVPLLVIDLWEHAYYLDYQHRRVDYIATFLNNLVNWEFANRNLRQALESRPTRPQELGSAATSSH